MSEASVRPSVDPREWPVWRVDDHLPALSAADLELSSLVHRLALTHPGSRPQEPMLVGDDTPLVGAVPPKSAAVLVALMPRPGGTQVVLTRRSGRLRHHAGQISFAGGRVDPADPDPRHTALREAQEEIGLDPSSVQVLGYLPTYRTGTGYDVQPVVAWLDPTSPLQPAPDEVAELFEVPLMHLMTPAHHRWHLGQWRERPHRFLSMLWPGPCDPSYFIWGATAAMLRNLYHALSPLGSPPRTD